MIRLLHRAIALSLLLVVCGTVAAGTPSDRKSWADSPEAAFMTLEERREWERVTDDDGAKQFIVAFRARRSADFDAEVARRAAVVDERLAVGDIRASATNRGRLVLLLGAPAELHVRHIVKPYRGSMGVMTPGRTGAVSKNRLAVRGGAEGWLEYTFRFNPRPELGIGPEGWTVVIEADVISGKDRVTERSERKRLDAILDAAARISLRAD